MTLTEIAYTLILGKPLVQWLGSLTFFLLLATSAVGLLALKGKFGLKQHQWIAYLTVFIALLHGLLNWLA